MFPQLEALSCSLFKHEIRLDEICTHQFSPMTAPSAHVTGELLAKLVFSPSPLQIRVNRAPMNISSAICHTVRGEEKGAHVMARLSDVISMDTHYAGRIA